MKSFSFLGSPLSLAILGPIVLAVLLYRKHKRAAMLSVATMAGEILLDLFLKPFFARTRADAYFASVQPQLH